MYRSCNMIEGTPPIIYRTPCEIRRDMARVSASINEINSRLNIRSLLLDIISEEESRPEKVIPSLENALAEAEEALAELSLLKGELSELEAELYELKCEMRI